MARRYREVDVDFAGIDAALSRLEPPTMELGDVLGRLRGRLAEKRDQGVALAVLCRTLKEHGVTVGERALGCFLDTGELPARGQVRNRTGAGTGAGRAASAASIRCASLRRSCASGEASSTASAAARSSLGQRAGSPP